MLFFFFLNWLVETANIALEISVTTVLHQCQVMLSCTSSVLQHKYFMLHYQLTNW